MTKTLKRYLLFAGPDYYPSGGWSDFVDSFDALEEVRARAVALDSNKYSTEWYQIVDSESGEVVEDG